MHLRIAFKGQGDRNNDGFVPLNLEFVHEFPLGFAVPDLVTIPAYMPATAVTFDVSTSLCQESPFDRTRSAHDPQ